MGGEGGGAGLLHKNACVMTGAAERRNALHNPNTVGAGPGPRWQPFLPIYFSSLSTQSPALSVALNIPGKMKNAKSFYLWLEGSRANASAASSSSVDETKREVGETLGHLSFIHSQSEERVLFFQDYSTCSVSRSKQIPTLKPAPGGLVFSFD